MKMETVGVEDVSSDPARRAGWCDLYYDKESGA
jgi:hypothetical protein